MAPDRENDFIAGYEDGVNDRRQATGRELGKENRDYGAGYVAGKYRQVLCRPIRDMQQALEIWRQGTSDFPAQTADPATPTHFT